MQNVPKIVSQRLRASAPVGNHPDADLLTAFAEQALLPRERTVVLEHLARCADCRDIVTLALPEIETTSPVVDPRRNWLAWPTLRWAFIAAGIVAIASFGLVRYQHNSRSNFAELRTPAPIQPVVTEQKPLEPALALSASTPRDEQPVTASKKKAEASPLAATLDNAPAAPAPKSRALGIGPGSGPAPNNLNHMQWQQQGAKQAQLAPPARVLNQRPSAAGVPPSENADAASNAVSQIARNETADHLPSDRMNDATTMSRAKPVVTEQATDMAAAPAAPSVVGTMQQDTFPKTSALPRWTISPAGTLQRSFDQGNTWQDVTVIADSLPKSNFAQAEVLSEVARAKVASNSKTSASNAPSAAKQSSAPSPLFRALAVNGAEIWAGGSNSLLYHSADAGSHWARVTPASSTSILSGDILALDFPDAQHGTIRTSASEVWTTSDGGQTWRKQ